MEMMMWPNMMGGFFGGGLGIIGMVIGYIFTALIIAGIIILIIWIVKRAGSSGIERTSNSGAVEILKQRYARGEITKREFDDIGKDLV
jgi:putative membrane protein